MSEEQKRLLEKQLWNIANVLRGKMNADEYKNYILGFIFYKYLSEQLEHYVNKKLLASEDYGYFDIKENTKDGKLILDEIMMACIGHLGFFLRPQELFSYLVKKGSGELKGEKSTFILEDLKNILNTIEQTAMGTESEDDFKGLFDDVDLSSSKLGSRENQKNEVIVEVLKLLNEIDFKLKDSKADLLGDAYEYLIGEFAAGAGKKGGEFYTPAQVSRLLAQIVSSDKKRIKSVYDPTCGSGSLLLRLADYTDVHNYYGQELNPTTYNLARMNMILHGIHFAHFDIRQGDTLQEDMHADLKAEAIIANPPFSAKWKSDTDPQLSHDDRFSQYGRLAPKGAADYAFITHMLHHLADNGTMAIVLPHGALFRSGAEGHIRKYIIEKQNSLDAVIGLPPNLFYGTGIPATILVFKKCRKEDDDILFIDASREFKKAKNQNYLTDQNIKKIFETYAARKEIDKYSHRANLREVIENKYNLNIPRYVDTFEEEEAVDIELVAKNLSSLVKLEEKLNLKIFSYCNELKIPKPEGNNIHLLKKYKKGLMQKIFSQDIRFKDDKGDHYPKWQEKTLEDLFTKKTKKNNSKEENFVLTNSAIHGIVSQLDYFDKDIANQNNLDGYYIVNIDDFVYNPRISKYAPVGPLKRNNYRKGIMSPLYTVLKPKVAYLDFLEKYFDTTKWHHYMCKIANYGARHDRMNISQKDLLQMPVPFPHISEQKKIADFLSSIDALIKTKSK
jgi:type I restriction enzyme M protein